MGHDGGHQEAHSSHDDAWSAATKRFCQTSSLPARRKISNRRHMARLPGRRKARVLVYMDRAVDGRILPSLDGLPEVDLQIIVDVDNMSFAPSEVGQDVKTHENDSLCPKDLSRNSAIIMKATELSQWADLLILPMSAGRMARLLAGLFDDLVLAVVRGWDISKRIIAIPEMSTDMWKNPITRRHLTEISRTWPHVNVLSPALWDLGREADNTLTATAQYHDPSELLQCVEDEIRPYTQGSEAYDYAPEEEIDARTSKSKISLPPELWTMILEALGDWEVATALHVYTTLPTPTDWLPYLPQPSSLVSPRFTIEYLILTAPFASIRAALSRPNAPANTLSTLAVNLILKFARTDLLTYLSLHQKDIFWSSFGLTLLPHKASIVYNQPSILTWWHTSPAVLKKEYGPEALDGASRAGFVDVLDWWLHSGLPLWYTERALESASAKGHLNVLKWWRAAAEATADRDGDAVDLRVGKSILAAAQSGHVAVLAWFCTETPSIPFSHEESVARIASTHGHVDVLSLWKELKGSKMIFDNQVLVGATKNGHVGVLEWWKRSGYRVEYKTCDIEEAMEDSVGGGEAEQRVRSWWQSNGLNLGVGTSEWMKVKIL